MKTLVTLALLLCLCANAQEDFSRRQVENDQFHDYTFKELISNFRETKALLPLYVCDGKNEFDPFWMPSTNPKKNSLTIQLYKEDRKLIYQNGKYFSEDGKEANEEKNIFLDYVKPVLKILETIPETAKLLRSLELSPFPVTIILGSNSFTPKEMNGTLYRGIYMGNAMSILDHGRMTSEEVPFYDIGVGGLINWNPKNTQFPGPVSLAHEMFHALDSVRGILDMRFVDGPDYEFAFVSEYRAVYMENITRKALGVSYRTHYNDITTGPGVLDLNGQPRYISSPCLK